jgi:hypothetical protein
MKFDENLKLRAFNNSINAIDIEQTMPFNIFRDQWYDYAFFESDMIFAPEFVNIKNAIMSKEGSQLLCLINLYNKNQKIDDNVSTLYLDRPIDAEEYMSLLRHKTDVDSLSWLVLMDRYVCASDIGEWCIYCEKENDIAVIAFRRPNISKRFSFAIEQLKATPVKSADKTQKAGNFQFSKLTPFWHHSLISRYF